MKNEIYQQLNMNDRDEVVGFLKSLWLEKPHNCPLCKGKLNHLHKKAKKSNNDWICQNCGKRYDAIKILDMINRY